MVSLRWLQWFQNVSDRIQSALMLDVAYNPGSIASGALATVTVNFDGVMPGDLIKGVSFSPMTVGGVPTPYIRTFGDVVQAGVVGVTFFNVGPGAIDLDAGTLRIQVERVT